MKTIPLTQGKVALVDDEDYEWLNQYKWTLVRNDNKEYAARNAYKEHGKNKIVTMHRVILGDTVKDKDTDHIDGNGLNNQRANLRACTRAENLRNCKKPQVNNELYKGIKTFPNQMWRAVIGHTKNGKATVTHLGMFFSPEAAAIAYDRAAKKLFGKFARLNFPNGEPDIDEKKKLPSMRRAKAKYRDFS